MGPNEQKESEIGYEELKQVSILNATEPVRSKDFSILHQKYRLTVPTQGLAVKALLKVHSRDNEALISSGLI